MEFSSPQEIGIGGDLAVGAMEVKQNHSLKIETVDPNPEEALLRDGMRAGQTTTG